MTRPHRDGGHEDPDAFPIFTIGTVAKQVGVSPPVLRVWESRYGTVLPYRDEHGRRLYSRRQIDELQWISDVISKGLTASEAHRMLKARRSPASVAEGGEVPGNKILEWVSMDRQWLTDLCAEITETVDGAAVAFVGVRDPASGQAESWVTIASHHPTRAEWFAVSAAGLEEGEPVILTEQRGDLLVHTAVVPVMAAEGWMAIVGIVTHGVGPAEAATEDMALRVSARFDAWQALERFEKLAGLDRIPADSEGSQA